MADWDKQAKDFVAYLQARQEDRGLMANLRRGLSDTTANRTWPYIARWCRLDHDRQRRIFEIVAASFAFNPESVSEGNMGTTMRQLTIDKNLRTFEARFKRILSCDTVFEVCERLPAVIRATKAKGVAINHQQLFKDLYYWDWGERSKIEWANAYWGNLREEETT